MSVLRRESIETHRPLSGSRRVHASILCSDRKRGVRVEIEYVARVDQGPTCEVVPTQAVHEKKVFDLHLKPCCDDREYVAAGDDVTYRDALRVLCRRAFCIAPRAQIDRVVL